MTQRTSLEKRIKRRITAREHDFFVIVAPGLERVCASELRELFPDKPITETDGGLEFSGTVRDCYCANLHLRIASRILMRIESFVATGFPKLEKKAAGIPWDLYLSETMSYSLFVSAKKSRLIHTDAIAERVSKSIQVILPNSSESRDEMSQKIYIRVQDDRFTISIDSSGDLLYKRGLKTGGGNAPIRETIAACALTLAGYDDTKPLIDPMCGSGTFSLEAALMASRTPPGWYRPFAFLNWPCFRPGTWKDIRRNSEKLIIDQHQNRIFASDLDPDICDRFAKTIQPTLLSKAVSITHTDFFAIVPSHLSNDAGLVIINPPYGLRLEKRHEAAHLFNRILDHFNSAYNGWTLALVSPFSPPKIKGLKLNSYPLFHGGLKLILIIARHKT